MRNKSNPEKNSSPAIICTAPWRVALVKPLTDYRLEVEFIDGTHGIVEMEGLISRDNAGVFLALKSKAIFEQVYLALGVVSWPGDIDLAPDAMYESIRKTGKWRL